MSIEALESLLNGRSLPSKIQLRLEKLIVDGDERIVKAMEGDARLEDICKIAVDDIFPIWENCFEGCTLYHAKQVSSSDRTKVTAVPSINLTYGEVKFESLAKAMYMHVDMKDRKVFYDVGSGSGRGVFCAALIHDFEKNVGVEIVPGLHDCAVKQLDLYNESIRPQLEEEAKAAGTELAPQELSFLCEDFRNFDWSDADVVWANSTCFGNTLMKHLSEYSERMKLGSIFITLTQKISSPHWEMVVPGELYPMSWGSATIYIWKKVLPAAPADEAESQPEVAVEAEAEKEAEETAAPSVE